MKTKEIKAYNLPRERIINESIEAKPYVLIILCILSGFMVFAYFNLTLGVTMMLFGFSILFLMPRRTLIEFTDDYMILFNKASHTECTMVYYEDVRSWRYEYGIALDELYIELSDDTVLSIEAFSRYVFESNMNHYLKDRKKKHK